MTASSQAFMRSVMDDVVELMDPADEEAPDTFAGALRVFAANLRGAEGYDDVPFEAPVLRAAERIAEFFGISLDGDVGTGKESGGHEKALARGVLQLADAGGMPDGIWCSDSRVVLARGVLGVPADGRYSHMWLWMGGEHG